jgi:hypothetical protein
VPSAIASTFLADSDHGNKPSFNEQMQKKKDSFKPVHLPTVKPPEGWSAFFDPKRAMTYYHNVSLNKTTWDKPLFP